MKAADRTGLSKATGVSKAMMLGFSWMAVTRMIYLGMATLGLAQMESWSASELVSLVLPVLPFLLHLALLFPRRHPVTSRYPYIFRWIYGLPLLAISASWLVYVISPVMGGHFGWIIAFSIRDSLVQVSRPAQMCLAVACLALAHLLLGGCWKAARVEGWTQGLLGRPIKTMLALLAAPVSIAIATVLGCLILGVPTDIPKASAVVFELVFRSQSFVAFAVVLIGFPAMTCASLVRSYRTLPQRS